MWSPGPGHVWSFTFLCLVEVSELLLSFCLSVVCPPPRHGPVLQVSWLAGPVPAAPQRLFLWRDARVRWSQVWVCATGLAKTQSVTRASRGDRGVLGALELLPVLRAARQCPWGPSLCSGTRLRDACPCGVGWG